MVPPPCARGASGKREEREREREERNRGERERRERGEREETESRPRGVSRFRLRKDARAPVGAAQSVRSRAISCAGITDRGEVRAGRAPPDSRCSVRADTSGTAGGGAAVCGLKSSASRRWTPRNAPVLTINHRGPDTRWSPRGAQAAAHWAVVGQQGGDTPLPSSAPPPPQEPGPR